MPKSKSKRSARAASSGGLPAHPGLRVKDPLLAYRLGDESPLRLPDQENQPSAATVLRSEYTIGSDAAGHAIFGECYNLTKSKLAWAVTTGSTGTFTSTAHPQYAAIVAEARYARMVAMKVSITYIGAEQTASGYLSYQEVPTPVDVNSSTVDSLHTGSTIQIRATEGLEVFVDYVQPPRYEIPSDDTFMGPTFPNAVFYASGLPASTAAVFRIRVVRFMEYLPLGGALAEGETMHEPSNPGAMAVHGELSGPATSIKVGGDPNWGTKVAGWANAAYHMAQPVLPYVVPRAREFLMGAVRTGFGGALALGL